MSRTCDFKDCYFHKDKQSQVVAAAVTAAHKVDRYMIL
jgi:hypothetical protein